MSKSPKNSGKANILVTGDFIVDRNILVGKRRFSSDKTSDGTRLIDLFGGSLLTYSLINKIIDREKNSSFGCSFDLEIPEPTDFVSKFPSRTAYSLWTKGKDEIGWKSGDILGYGFEKTQKQGQNQASQTPYIRTRKSIFPDWIIIDEGNLDFRNSNKAWPDFKDKNIIMKCCYPFHEGELIQRLTQATGKPRTLIIIISLTNLRKGDVKIGSGISWEQTALDISAELERNKRLNVLLKADHLIVMAGASGALHLQNNEEKGKTELNLVFDPFNIEGEWETVNPLLSGSGSCFLAAFSCSMAAECHGSQVKPRNIEKSIRDALNAVRSFCRSGLYEEGENGIPDYCVSEKEGKKPDIKETTFSSAFVPSPFHDKKNFAGTKDSHWSILCGNYLDLNKKGDVSQYLDLACELAIKGPDAVLFAPVMAFGKIVSFDRKESESFRNIKKLMIDYAEGRSQTRPLNIAVFGAPGSGKSFAVKQMSREFLKKYEPDILEFNLSQFKDSLELAGAFHAIRDSVLNGKLPVVFWDEFDSESLRWLKSLLAPMQDGQFQDGKDIHPIGKAIFIFAGGTSCSFQDFNPINNKKSNDTQIASFINVKGPDFVSRIHGYLNVGGPNPSGKEDVTYPVRRAMFIRNGFGMKGSSILQIDSGLLRALLSVKTYLNGARSLDRIISHLKSGGNRKIVRSDLPSDDVISMNTDFTEFCDLMYAESTDEKNAALMIAPFIHKTWMGKQVADSSFYREFYMLSDVQRQDNIAAASRISEVLAVSGKFGIEENYSSKPDASLDFMKYISDAKKLEPFSEKEHILWEHERRKRGWVNGKNRSDYFKIHPCIIEYNKLSEEEKDKDRDTIKKYPEFLKGSGYKIVKV